jgi:hypothetical protein
MAILSAHSLMHRVLAIPELLDMIFGFLDEGFNATNARVSKQWSEIALDTLWRDVSDLYRLFGLLAPLEKTSEGDYVSIFHLVPRFTHGSTSAGFHRGSWCRRVGKV